MKHQTVENIKTDANNRWFALPQCWCTEQRKICSHSLHKNGS